jgi:hypothetical protein
MKTFIAILATCVILISVSAAMAQDMPPLTYDFTWTVNSTYHAQGDPGPSSHTSFSGSGPLTYVASLRPQPLFGEVTMSFSGGTFRFHEVGTAAGVHADDDFSFTTGLEAHNPPIPGSCGSFPAQGNCRVAAFTTASNAFAAPSSFTLTANYGFECLPQFGGCNGAGSWSSSLDGVATLHTSTASAAEPATLIVVAASLVGAARMVRRRSQR